MAREFLQRQRWALRWDGTNGTDVAQLWTDMPTDGAEYVLTEQIAGDHMTMQVMVGGLPFSTRTLTADRPWSIADYGYGSVETCSDQEKIDRYTAGVRTTDVPAAGVSVATMNQAIADAIAPLATSAALTALTNKVNGMRQYLAVQSVTLPAAALLAAGTRTIAVTWRNGANVATPLPTADYDVGFAQDNTLVVAGSPYTFAVASSPARTVSGFTLQYTNAAVLTLGSGVLHCIASKAGPV